MVKRILVPLDGSARAEGALPAAGWIARGSGGTVVLMQVVNFPATYGQYLAQTRAFTSDLLDVQQIQAENYLKHMAKSDDLDGVEKTIQVVRGAPALAILAVAHEQQADLILLCSHGRTGLRRWALGSAVQKVARQSPVPVLVLREGGPQLVRAYSDMARLFRGLVPLDGSALAEEALVPAADLIMALSTSETGVLHLTCVVELPAADSEPGQHLEPQAREQALSQATTYLSTVADQLRHDLAGTHQPAITWSVVTDEDVAHGILRVAEEGESADYDLIAMATHGRSGIQRWVVGSITERVLLATKRPLLIVRSWKAREEGSGGETTEAEISS